LSESIELPLETDPALFVGVIFLIQNSELSIEVVTLGNLDKGEGNPPETDGLLFEGISLSFEAEGLLFEGIFIEFHSEGRLFEEDTTLSFEIEGLRFEAKSL
jgi:hypothetical protein